MCALRSFRESKSSAAYFRNGRDRCGGETWAYNSRRGWSVHDEFSVFPAVYNENQQRRLAGSSLGERLSFGGKNFDLGSRLLPTYCDSMALWIPFRTEGVFARTVRVLIFLGSEDARFSKCSPVISVEGFRCDRFEGDPDADNEVRSVSTPFFPERGCRGLTVLSVR